MSLENKIRILKSGIGGWEGIIYSMATGCTGKGYEKISYEIVEQLPLEIIKFMDIDDKNDALYCSDDMFIIICKAVIIYTKNDWPDVSEAANKLLEEGY